MKINKEKFKKNITIKKKLTGSFFISFLIIFLIFSLFLLPNYRENQLNEFKMKTFGNFRRVDEFIHSSIDISSMKLDVYETNDLLKEDKIIVEFLSYTWKDEVGSFHICMGDYELMVDEGLNPIKHKMTDERLNQLERISDTNDSEIVIIDGEEFYLFAKKSRHSDLLYYNLVNVDYLRHKQLKVIEPIIFISLAILISFCVVLLFLIHKIVIIPIRKLNDVTKTIVSTGNLELKTNILCHDEIGQMSKSFDAMVDNLKYSRDNLEAQVKLRTEKLNEAKKMAESANEAKSHFLANMSHEIRTPINGVIGLNDLLLKTKLNFRQKDYAIKIKKSANNLLHIINDILDFSKVESGKMEIEQTEFNIEQVVDDVASVTGVKATNAGVELITKINNNVPRGLIGDPVRVNQVILNLVNNAIKFTEQGEVLFEIALQEEQDEMVKLEFIIKDTGIGMSADQIEHLFDEFTQADVTTTRKYGGTGLGLAISNKLVDLMNGSINVESQPGEGTKFSVTIPFEKMAIALEGDKPLYKALNNKRVLIIDDNKDALLTFEEYLKGYVRSTYCASSSHDGLRAMELNQYDIVIVDYKMYPENGLEFIDKFKASERINYDPKILLATAYGKELFKNNIDEYPIDDILMKPIQSKELLDKIHQLFKSVKHDSAIQIDNKIASERKILLAEDNEINQMIVIENLTSKGYVVEVANHGKEAIEKAKNNRYDLILMDLQMPVCSGYEASETINGFLDIPIVALSADILSDVHEAIKKSGMVDLVSKPIDFDELYSVLDRYLFDKEDKLNKHSEKITTDDTTFSYLNVADGLKRVNNNQQVYSKALTQFQKMLQDIVPTIDSLVTQNDYTVLAEQMHKLKGVAGNLSIRKLFENAESIEKQAKEGIIDKKAVELLLDSSKQILREIKAFLIVENTSDRTSESTNEYMDVLSKLSKMLGSYDISAYDYLMESESIFTQNTDLATYTEILELISDYEFDQALDSIKNLKK